jgi:hypothetical protein
MLGCWRVEASDTLLLFDRSGLMTRAHTGTGDWHPATRIAGEVRSVASWRLAGDSTGPVRVRGWEDASDLFIWPGSGSPGRGSLGRDSLEAALVPRDDRPRPALTEQQRVDREARRLRSAAYERRLTLIRQDAQRCAP